VNFKERFVACEKDLRLKSWICPACVAWTFLGEGMRRVLKLRVVVGLFLLALLVGGSATVSVVAAEVTFVLLTVVIVFWLCARLLNLGSAREYSESARALEGCGLQLGFLVVDVWVDGVISNFYVCYKVEESSILVKPVTRVTCVQRSITFFPTI
jgi:hypothetical protein